MHALSLLFVHVVLYCRSFRSCFGYYFSKHLLTYLLTFLRRVRRGGLKFTHDRKTSHQSIRACVRRRLQAACSSEFITLIVAVRYFFYSLHSGRTVRGDEHASTPRQRDATAYKPPVTRVIDQLSSLCDASDTLNSVVHHHHHHHHRPIFVIIVHNQLLSKPCGARMNYKDRMKPQR